MNMMLSMKGIIVFVFVNLGRCASYICNYNIIFCLFPFLWRCFYTGIMKSFFKSFGSGSLINPKFCYLKGAQYISIGKNTFLDKNMELTAYNSYRIQKDFHPFITIGDDCHIGMNAKITAIYSIKIGNGVLMGRNVLITDNAHGRSIRDDIAPADRPLIYKEGTVVEDNVWLGDNVSILPGVRIGKGCIVGVNSVVTKDIPPYSVVGGIPAKVLKTME